MSRTLPLPAGMRNRKPFMQTAAFKWLSALPILLLSSIFLNYLRHRVCPPRRKKYGLIITREGLLGLNYATESHDILYTQHVGGIVDKGMPCSAARDAIQTIEIASTTDEELAKYDGKAVMVRGALHPEVLMDQDFGLQYNGVFLRRSIEMYQWTKDGSEYHKHWYPYVVDSSSFSRGHLNPLAMPFHDAEYMAPRIHLEHQIEISPLLIDQFNFAHRVPVRQQDIERLPPNLQGTFRVANDQFFRGRDVRHPSVGDVRVHFSGIAAVNVTIIAQLKGMELVPCSSAQDTANRVVDHREENAFVRPGYLSLAQMRAEFTGSIDHTLGLPWWLVGLGILHLFLFGGVGFMVFYSQSVAREARQD